MDTVAATTPMKRSLPRDLALVMSTGAAAPWLLLATWGSAHAAVRGPSGRIAAFFAPNLYRPRHNFGALALDAAIGLVVGAALAAVIARFTHAARRTLWIAFAAAFLVSALAAGSDGIATRLGLLVRQPWILFVLCGAALGLWLGPRGGKASAVA